VCDPRQVWTVVTSFGRLISEMSKDADAAHAQLADGSGTPSNPQSARLLFASDDMNRQAS